MLNFVFHFISHCGIIFSEAVQVMQLFVVVYNEAVNEVVMVYVDKMGM